MAANGKPDIWERMKAKLAREVAVLAAIGREGIKDIRGTIMEIAFGKPEHVSEPGTPLNPTPQIITSGLTGKPLVAGMDAVYGKANVAGKVYGNVKDERGGNDGPGKEKGQERGGPEM